MKLIASLFLSLFMFSGLVQDDPSQVAGDWSGILNVPGGQALKLVFHVTNNNGTLSATMDSPDQQAFGLKMDKASFRAGTLELTMNQIQGSYKGTLKNGKLEGTWTQSGQSFPLNLEKK